MKLISSLLNWFYLLRLKLTEKKLYTDDSPLQPVESVKECTRDKATRERVAKAFKEQAQQMQARALKSHGSDCKDPAFCTKQKCFVWAPDTIVKKSIVKRRMRRISSCTKNR